jgi:hypothetical protein
VLEFKPVTKEFMQFIADNMRHADAVEVMASNGLTPTEAIELSVEMSDYVTAIYIDGDPVAVMGLRLYNALAGVGVPWLLGTDNVVKHRKVFLKNSRDVVEDMKYHCPKLVNHVHVENTVSIQWLKWLGFEFDEPEPFGVNGELFHRFHMGMK